MRTPGDVSTNSMTCVPSSRKPPDLIRRPFRVDLPAASMIHRRDEPHVSWRAQAVFHCRRLRQCLSSHEQLGASAILQKSLPRQRRFVDWSDRARGTTCSSKYARVRRVNGSSKRYRCNSQRPATVSKISSQHADAHCGALQAALVRTASALVEPFVDEQIVWRVVKS